MLSAALAASAVALTAVPAGADPGAPPSDAHSSDARSGSTSGQSTGQSTSSARRTVERLFHDAERATEKYNLAKERTDQLRERVSALQSSVARGQERVNEYGCVDPSLTLLLTEDPDGFLTKSAALDRISNRQSCQLRLLHAAQRALRQERAEATGRLVELERSREAVARHKREVTVKLAAARAVLNGLTAAERAALRRSERAKDDHHALARHEERQPAGTSAAASPRRRRRGERRAARHRRPVRVGPERAQFLRLLGADPVGLAAGRGGHPAHLAGPRRRRAAGAARPGAAGRPGGVPGRRQPRGMYVGGGQVIHAPHPGANVRYDPVRMMPVTSVNRP